MYDLEAKILSAGKARDPSYRPGYPAGYPDEKDRAAPRRRFEAEQRAPTGKRRLINAH
ncbi:MAG: hypothetical protein ACE5GG_02885 [Candidatus Omnitrophota bacterium]